MTQVDTRGPATFLLSGMAQGQDAWQQMQRFRLASDEMTARQRQWERENDFASRRLLQDELAQLQEAKEFEQQLLAKKSQANVMAHLLNQQLAWSTPRRAPTRQPQQPTPDNSNGPATPGEGFVGPAQESLTQDLAEQDPDEDAWRRLIVSTVESADPESMSLLFNEGLNRQTRREYLAFLKDLDTKMGKEDPSSISDPAISAMLSHFRTSKNFGTVILNKLMTDGHEQFVKRLADITGRKQHLAAAAEMGYTSAQAELMGPLGLRDAEIEKLKRAGKIAEVDRDQPGAEAAYADIASNDPARVARGQGWLAARNMPVGHPPSRDPLADDRARNAIDQARDEFIAARDEYKAIAGDQAPPTEDEKRLAALSDDDTDAGFFDFVGEDIGEVRDARRKVGAWNQFQAKMVALRDVRRTATEPKAASVAPASSPPASDTTDSAVLAEFKARNGREPTREDEALLDELYNEMTGGR